MAETECDAGVGTCLKRLDSNVEYDDGFFCFQPVRALLSFGHDTIFLLLEFQSQTLRANWTGLSSTGKRSE
jgi:hypothetical protein